MKIIGITKVRNESLIMKETLDHWAKHCSGGIYVYDDASIDNTVDICIAHPAVKMVVEGKTWDSDRERAEHVNRQAILRWAQDDAGKDDWFVYFDADERLYFNDWNILFSSHAQAIACKLYDIYITPEDRDKNYLERGWVGPEFRTIVFFFRNSPYIGYDKPDQRIVNLAPNTQIYIAGSVKHYGKGLSVEHWEETCDYYIDHWPKYSAKWQQRKGKAIHHDYLSDFGNPLIKWEDRDRKGFPLEDKPYGKN